MSRKVQTSFEDFLVCIMLLLIFPRDSDLAQRNKFSDLGLICEYKILLSHHLWHGTNVSDCKTVLCMWLQIPTVKE